MHSDQATVPGEEGRAETPGEADTRRLVEHLQAEVRVANREQTIGARQSLQQLSARYPQRLR